ncbi:MAG: threonine synthase [Bacteroidales bacterium]
MNYYNINNPVQKVSLKTAVLQSISSESGLYMPEFIPRLKDSFFDKLTSLNFKEIALEVSKAMLGDDIPTSELEKIVNEALTFPVPIIKLDQQLYVLELFHGPTFAFKDIGARFMAGVFNYFLQNKNREVCILVATSGDTGSAVANAFFNQKNVKVVILYPSGKVSELQEKQLTTMGGNITALEVDGNFDDCQRMAKQAFTDEELNKSLYLTSANSINFIRLFPQTFYYFYALAQLGKTDKPIVISIPSGNFGNLTAALIAKKMGLTIHQIIASTNKNHVVPDFLKSGEFNPQPTYYTISNAMDVGNPSNFPRMIELYKNSTTDLQNDVKGHWFSDEQTRSAMAEIYSKYAYQADPHGAIAYAGLKEYGISDKQISIFIETAHPAKFPFEVEKSTKTKVELPSSLKNIVKSEKKSIKIQNDFLSLRKTLLNL